MARRTSKTRTAEPVAVDTAALYGLPPGEFIAARDRMARALRGAGDDREAARIKSLRRPATAVWAVNQLARRHKKPMDALLQAGDRLRAAQRALGPSGAAPLRAASVALHGPLVALLDAAEKLLADAGFSAAGKHLDGVRNTLQAAAGASDAQRDQLRRGVLTAPLEAAEFTDVLGMLDPRGPAAPDEPAAATKRSARRTTKRGASTARQTSKTAAKRTAKSATRTTTKSAAKRTARAEQAAKRARERALRDAQARARQAERAAAAAERARRAADRAEARARAARDRADAAERAAGQAHARAHR